MDPAAALRGRVLLSLQRALVGEVTPQMRYIGVEHSPARIHILIWHDGELAAVVREYFDASVVTQVVSDFTGAEYEGIEVTYEFIQVDAPARPALRGTLVYGRSELGSE